MTTDRNHPITTDDLNARLNRLERRSRWMGAGWVATAALLGGALMLGQGQDADHPWLTVKGLTVVDDAGRIRAHLGGVLPDLNNPQAPSDASGLILLDENGAEAASFTMKTSGARMLTVADPSTDRIALVSWPGGESGVYVLGPEDSSGYRHQLAVDNDGKTYSIMRSSDGEYIHRIGEPGSGGAGGGAAQAARPAIPQGAGAGGWGGAGAGGAGAGGWGGAGGGAGAGMPGAGRGAGMPGAGMPGAGMPGAGMPGAGMGAGGFPGAGMPGAGMPGAGMPGAGAGAGGAPGANMQDLEEMRRQMIERMNLPPEEKQKLLDRMNEMEERREAALEEARKQREEAAPTESDQADDSGADDTGEGSDDSSTEGTGEVEDEDADDDGEG